MCVPVNPPPPPPKMAKYLHFERVSGAGAKKTYSHHNSVHSRMCLPFPMKRKQVLAFTKSKGHYFCGTIE